MLSNMINDFIKNNVIAKGLKIKALTTNKTSGIFEYRKQRYYFYTEYSNNFQNTSLIIERA